MLFSSGTPSQWIHHTGTVDNLISESEYCVPHAITTLGQVRPSEKYQHEKMVSCSLAITNFSDKNPFLSNVVLR